MKASQLFTPRDRERIAEAIAAAESRTSGEIIPVAAGESGRYDRAEDVFGVLTALALLASGWTLSGMQSGGEDWMSPGTPPLGLFGVVLLVIVGFAAGAALASFVPVLRLPFILRQEMDEEVDRSAAEAFHRFRLRETAGATGILIYISLYEHRVRVLGDSAISGKIGEADWQAICAGVTDGMKRGMPAEGLVQGITRAGELLARHFPREAADRNELVNELKLLD